MEATLSRHCCMPLVTSVLGLLAVNCDPGVFDPLTEGNGDEVVPKDGQRADTGPGDAGAATTDAGGTGGDMLGTGGAADAGGTTPPGSCCDAGADEMRTERCGPCDAGTRAVRRICDEARCIVTEAEGACEYDREQWCDPASAGEEVRYTGGTCANYCDMGQETVTVACTDQCEWQVIEKSCDIDPREFCWPEERGVPSQQDFRCTPGIPGYFQYCYNLSCQWTDAEAAVCDPRFSRCNTECATEAVNCGEGSCEPNRWRTRYAGSAASLERCTTQCEWVEVCSSDDPGCPTDPW